MVKKRLKHVSVLGPLCVRPLTKGVKHYFPWYVLGIRKYSSTPCVGPEPSKISPWFITGFTDAEGCFSVSVYKDLTRSIGWRVHAEFLIGLHKRDIGLLKDIQNSLGGIGRIGKFAKDACALRVNTLSGALKIIDHFDKYPLISQKRADYLIWREIIMMMHRKEHITQEGLLAIIRLKASLNLGLSESLKTAFPDIIPSTRPEIGDSITIPHGDWLAGFTSGEGCFFVFVHESLTNKSGYRVQLMFQITQHSRDSKLIQSLTSYLGCGKLVTTSDNKVLFRVQKFSDNLDKIIEFFHKHKIQGVKYEDFKDWCKVAKLMKDMKAHLTPEGLEKIVKIKKGMNKGRV
jgi:hypothetical protein